MHIGLTLTYWSSVQMLRGSIIIFVAILSIAFLKRRLNVQEWIGILFIFIGLFIVGAADISMSVDGETPKLDKIIIGDILVVLAQVIIALQMVYEDKYANKFNIPALQVIGWEGIFGFITISVLLVPMHFIQWNENHKMEDIPFALRQIGNDWRIVVSLLVSVLSFAVFNYSGLSLTKEKSAITRMVLDSLRTILVWAFELAFEWKNFHYLQLLGFVVYLFGMCSYNDFLVPQAYQRLRKMYDRSNKTESQQKYQSTQNMNNRDQNATEINPESRVFDQSNDKKM